MQVNVAKNEKILFLFPFWVLPPGHRGRWNFQACSRLFKPIQAYSRPPGGAAVRGAHPPSDAVRRALASNIHLSTNPLIRVRGVALPAIASTPGQRGIILPLILELRGRFGSLWKVMEGGGGGSKTPILKLPSTREAPGLQHPMVLPGYWMFSGAWTSWDLDVSTFLPAIEWTTSPHQRAPH